MGTHRPCGPRGLCVGTPGPPAVSCGVAWGYARPPHGSHTATKQREERFHSPFSFESLSLQAVWSRQHPAPGLELAAGKEPVGSGARRNAVGPPHFRLSYSPGLPRLPSPHAGSLLTRRRLTTGWPLPPSCHSPAPPRGPASQPWSLCPKALARAPLPDKPCPLLMVGACPPQGPAGPRARVHPCSFGGGTHGWGGRMCQSPTESTAGPTAAPQAPADSAGGAGHAWLDFPRPPSAPLGRPGRPRPLGW